MTLLFLHRALGSSIKDGFFEKIYWDATVTLGYIDRMTFTPKTQFLSRQPLILSQWVSELALIFSFWLREPAILR